MLIPVTTCPIPLNGTWTGVTPAVDDDTTSVADICPTAAGVKPTCTVQLLPVASVAPHVLALHEKLVADEPMIWKPMLLIGAPPLLVTVKTSGDAACPVNSVAKVSCAGATPIAGGCSPIPESDTACV